MALSRPFLPICQSPFSLYITGCVFLLLKLLLLDEPTNHLDVDAVDGLAAAIKVVPHTTFTPHPSPTPTMTRVLRIPCVDTDESQTGRYTVFLSWCCCVFFFFCFCCCVFCLFCLFVCFVCLFGWFYLFVCVLMFVFLFSVASLCVSLMRRDSMEALCSSRTTLG